MTFKTGNIPWNKGIKNDPRNGWSEERRRRMSELMRERYKDMGPQPHRWKTGPDPWIRSLRRKFLLAKNQATYWRQRWTITWPFFLKFMRQQYQHGRSLGAVNFSRIDKRKGWTPQNVHMLQRSIAVGRPKVKDRFGNIVKRKRKNSDLDKLHNKSYNKIHKENNGNDNHGQ